MPRFPDHLPAPRFAAAENQSPVMPSQQVDSGFSRRTFFAVLLPFACGYFVSFLFRSINAMISTDLVADFSLAPQDLGLLTSAYFFAFALFQLPLGMLLDRYGPRRVNASLMLVAAVGAALFATSGGMQGLLWGRALIGLGVSACLMASIKAFVIWFPLSRLPSLTGVILFAGGLGALSATAPVEAALHVMSWRGVFAGLTLLTAVVAAAIFFIVPERAAHASHESFSGQLRGVAQVFTNRRFWQVTLVAMCTQSTFMSIQGLWAGPWFKDVAGLDRAGVASHLLYLAMATLAGALFFGNAATYLQKRGVPTMRVFKLGVGASMPVQFFIVMGFTSWVVLPWVLYGFFWAAGTLAYAVLSHYFPPAMAGRANTGLNLMVFVCAFACQWGIGAIINLWPVVDGKYHPGGYQAAFGLFLALQVAALAWLILDETRMKALQTSSPGA